MTQKNRLVAVKNNVSGNLFTGFRIYGIGGCVTHLYVPNIYRHSEDNSIALNVWSCLWLSAEIYT